MVQKIGSITNRGTRKGNEKINENLSKPFSLPIDHQHNRKRFIGVRQSPSGRWVAEIKGTNQKIRLWLGTFDTPEDAAHAYDEAACLLRGANTRTNFWQRTIGGFERPSSSKVRKTSVLSPEVLNHLLNHLKTEHASKSPQSLLSEPSKPPLLPPPQHQQQHNNNHELELISRMAYGGLFSDVNTYSVTTHSGDEGYGLGCENNIHGEMKCKLEVERAVNLDMDFRLEDFSKFYAPFKIEGWERGEIRTYEY